MDEKERYRNKIENSETYQIIPKEREREREDGSCTKTKASGSERRTEHRKSGLNCPARIELTFSH